MAVVLLWCAVGCSTVPETGRSQFNLISPSMEPMGRDAFTWMSCNSLSQDQEATALVRVWENALPVAVHQRRGEFIRPSRKQPYRRGARWGYTGLLPITQSEAGLATVLAHEVARRGASWFGAN